MFYRYDELSNKGKKKFDKINIEYPQNVNGKADANEVLVAVSITNTIVDYDLQQFKGMDKVTITLDKPKDNVIISLRQLDDYCQTIVDTIERLKTKYASLSRVYLAASIPSCVSVELGKKMALNRNRLPEIVSVHYMNSNTPRYPFGVVVSGDNDSYGKLIDLQNGVAVV